MSVPTFEDEVFDGITVSLNSFPAGEKVLNFSETVNLFVRVEDDQRADCA
jgi:hypothetical protein